MFRPMFLFKNPDYYDVIFSSDFSMISGDRFRTIGDISPPE